MKRFTHEPATRTRFYLFLILSVLGAMIGPAFAQAERAPGLTQTVVSASIPSNSTPAFGEFITVVIAIDMSGMAPPNNFLTSFKGSLNWNPEVLLYISNSGLLNGFVGYVNDIITPNGSMDFNGESEIGAGGVFDILEITLKVVGGAGSWSALDLEYWDMNSGAQSLLPFLIIVDGQIATIGSNNNPPQLQPIEDQGVVAGQILEVEISATDPDGDAITLTVNNLPAFGSFIDHGDGSGTITFAPTIGDVGAYPNIEVIAADDGIPSLQDTVHFSLWVMQNFISAVVPSDSLPSPGDTLAVAINFDMNGMAPPCHLLGAFDGILHWDPMILQYVGASGFLQGFSGVVNTTNAATGELRFNAAKPPGQAGQFDVVIFYYLVTGSPGAPVMMDLAYFSVSPAICFINIMPFLIIVDGQIAVVGDNNNPPVLQAIEDQTAIEITPLAVEVIAADPDSDVITLMVNNLPSFGSFIDHGDGSGTITFTAGLHSDTGAYSNIEVIAADDGVPPLQDTVYFSLTVIPIFPSALVPSDTLPAPGDTLAVAVNFDLTRLSPPENIMGSFTGFLHWDPSVLQYVGNSGLLQGFIGSVFNLDPVQGTLKFNGVSNTPQGGQFDVLIFYYLVTGDPGAPVIMDLGYQAMNCFLCFNNSLLVLVTPLDGQIAVVGNPAVLTDSLPPDCITLGVNPGPPVTLDIALQDTGSGLAQVQTLTLVNAALNVPPFTPGTTEQIILTAAKVNQTQPSTVLIEAFDLAGNSVVCDPVYMQAAAGIPGEFDLAQNYPNPFNPATTIRFQLPPTGQAANRLVTLKIYDITGRLVKTLLRESLPAGYYTVPWDGTGERGEGVAGGVYLYRLSAGDYVKTRKMLLVK